MSPRYVPTPGIFDSASLWRTYVVPKVREDLGRVFATGKTRDIAWRKEQILGLVYMLKDNIGLFNAALAKDLGRAPLETHMYAPQLRSLKGAG